MRLSFIFYVPRVLARLATVKNLKNILHNGKRKLSGKKICATSSDILFKDIRAAAKHKNVTINDLITACLATGVK